MQRILAATVLFLCLPGQLFACYWDQDTLANEAHQMPDLVQAAVGRFPRNPKLFYLMRIAPETKMVGIHPENLGLYDDLAVAQDRIGNDELAVKWIEAKRSRMGDLGKAKTIKGKRDAFSEAAYRYYANAGTIWLVRWMRQGGKVADKDQLERADHLIARAIEINPDAHFGREKVQLDFIRWLLNNVGAEDPVSFSDYLEGSREDQADEIQRRKDVKGLVGSGSRLGEPRHL